MNPFSKLTNGVKVMKNCYKLLIHLARTRASPCQYFSAIFVPSGSEREAFSTQIDWFYSYQCNEPIFKVDKWGKSYEKSLQTSYSFLEKSCVAMPTSQRHIHSIRLRTGRFFNTDWLIWFIPMQWTHFQSWQMGKKVQKIVQTFYSFSKNCASPWQLFSLIFIPSGSEREDFSTQTDWFYSYQCNQPIFISISEDSQGSCYTAESPPNSTKVY